MGYRQWYELRQFVRTVPRNDDLVPRRYLLYTGKSLLSQWMNQFQDRETPGLTVDRPANMG